MIYDVCARRFFHFRAGRRYARSCAHNALSSSQFMAEAAILKARFVSSSDDTRHLNSHCKLGTSASQFLSSFKDNGLGFIPRE